MPILTVTVALDPEQNAWNVRRAHTVVAAYASRDQAIVGASEIAFELRGRMDCDTRIRVHDRSRGWHEYLALNDHRSAAAMALRVLYKCRLPAPDHAAERVRALRPLLDAAEKTQA